MYEGLGVKYRSLTYFNKSPIFSVDFREIPKYQI